MADIRYNPQFEHTNWRDRQDRVIADGPNGFNLRFNTIAADFQTLSQVVTQIATALDALEHKPSGPITLTLTPNLVGVVNASPSIHWGHGGGNAFIPLGGGQSRANGIMWVGFTERVQIQSFRAIGRNVGSLHISLWRKGIDIMSGPQRIADITRDGIANNPNFDVKVTADEAFATIDPAEFSCFIEAEATTSPTLGVTVHLRAFQITYQPL
jgi:hypothetical protein